MVSRLRRKRTLQRKHRLKVKRNLLNLKFEAIKREYLHLLNHLQLPTDVKLEKIGEGYGVKVTCKKEGDLLVAILETFEQMGFDVLQARISSNYVFAMEAIVVPYDHHAARKSIDVRDINASIIEAIERQIKPIEKTNE